MSRFKTLHRLFFLLLLVAGSGMGRAGHAETVKVCYDQWSPLTIFPSNGSSARGVVCDVLPEYVGSTNTANEFVYGNEPTFAYTTAFVIRRDDPWRYHGIQSIRGKRVATGPGWDYSSMSVSYQDYIEDPKNADLVEVIAGYDDVVDRIFRMIVEDRVDLYADNELVLQHILNRLNLHDDLQIVHPGLERKLVERPIFSTRIPAAKRQELIRIWDEGRRAIKGEAEKRILEKYNVKLEDPS